MRDPVYDGEVPFESPSDYVQAQLDHLFEIERPEPSRSLVGPFHRGGTDTERAAATNALPRKGTQRARVLDLFQRTRPGGFTDYELGRALGMFRWVAGTRRGELIHDGWPIVDSGERRRTDTGSNAIVWVLA